MGTITVNGTKHDVRYIAKDNRYFIDMPNGFFIEVYPGTNDHVAGKWFACIWKHTNCFGGKEIARSLSGKNGRGFYRKTARAMARAAIVKFDLMNVAHEHGTLIINGVECPATMDEGGAIYSGPHIKR